MSEKEIFATPQVPHRIDGDGVWVEQKQVFRGTFAETLELWDFPFDVQVLKVDFLFVSVYMSVCVSVCFCLFLSLCLSDADLIPTDLVNTLSAPPLPGATTVAAAAASNKQDRRFCHRCGHRCCLQQPLTSSLPPPTLPKVYAKLHPHPCLKHVPGHYLHPHHNLQILHSRLPPTPSTLSATTVTAPL